MTVGVLPRREESFTAIRMNEAGEQCWLCHRELGRKREWHHPVPRQKGGRAVVPLHPICHRTIHAHLTNAQLARLGADREAILHCEPIARFVAWVAKKPADFHAPTYGRR